MGFTDNLVYPSTADPSTPPAPKGVAGASPLAAALQSTSQWMGIYGQVIVDGAPAAAGSVVDVVDAGGHVTARFEVHHPGYHGYLPVYLDDPATAQDEGADVGEWLTVRVNGQPAAAQVQWTEFGDLAQVPAEAVSVTEGGVPRVFRLAQNHPNPFNPTTTITYQLPSAAEVVLSVYNLSGQLVRELVHLPQVAGHHSVTWDGRDEAGRLMANGVYLYQVRAGEFRSARKMALLRWDHLDRSARKPPLSSDLAGFPQSGVLVRTRKRINPLLCRAGVWGR